MLVGLSGYLAGYNGSFEFKSGEVYPEELNYVFMRIFNAVFGILCVPLVFYTARSLKFSNQAVYLVTLMVLCGTPSVIMLTLENSYATISRFILLDSMLLFFTATTMFSLVKFHSYRKQEFEPWWWIWCATTGISIGCVCRYVFCVFLRSVKWVGMFGLAVVGLYTVEDLWHKFGDLSIPRVRSLSLHLHRMYTLAIGDLVSSVSLFCRC
jgi:dolichyl-phosphate-mannose-protein mannosyltransferase